MKKNDKIHIPISTEDKVKIKKRAESVGLSLTQYCRYVLLQSKARVEED